MYIRCNTEEVHILTRRVMLIAIIMIDAKRTAFLRSAVVSSPVKQSRNSR